jgi:hypothetical protein
MNQKPERRLSVEALEKFKELYKVEFNEDLTDDEAELIAIRLLRFFRILVYGNE